MNQERERHRQQVAEAKAGGECVAKLQKELQMLKDDQAQKDQRHRRNIERHATVSTLQARQQSNHLSLISMNLNKLV